MRNFEKVYKFILFITTLFAPILISLACAIYLGIEGDLVLSISLIVILLTCTLHNAVYIISMYMKNIKKGEGENDNKTNN